MATYAIVKTGGKQYKVAVGDIVKVEKLDSEPGAKVSLPVALRKPDAPATFAGLFAFTVPTAGRYRVALGAGAWIEVARDGKAVASAAHAHGPACTPVRKMVDFDLQPGTYLLQVSGSTAPRLHLLVAHLR